MTKNPFYNALIAFSYIVLVVFLMNLISQSQPSANSFLAPIMIISLFTLSAAVMAYIFGYQPVMLYLDNKKERAVKLFLQTVGIFACLTFIPFILFLTGILS